MNYSVSPAKVIFSQHKRNLVTEYVSFSPLLQTLLPTRGHFSLLTDSKNKSLCAGRWENKAFRLKGTDFLLHMQELIPTALLGVWLYSQNGLLCRKMNYFLMFFKNCLH